MREMIGTALGAVAGGGFWAVFGGIGLVSAAGPIGLGLAGVIGVGSVIGLAGAGVSRFFD